MYPCNSSLKTLLRITRQSCPPSDPYPPPPCPPYTVPFLCYSFRPACIICHLCNSCTNKCQSQNCPLMLSLLIKSLCQIPDLLSYFHWKILVMDVLFLWQGKSKVKFKSKTFTELWQNIHPLPMFLHGLSLFLQFYPTLSPYRTPSPPTNAWIMYASASPACSFKVLIDYLFHFNS